MSIMINEDFMSLEIIGAEITAAVRVDHLWRVTGWSRLLTRNEVITAVMLSERLAPGRGRRASRSAPWGSPARAVIGEPPGAGAGSRAG